MPRSHTNKVPLQEEGERNSDGQSDRNNWMKDMRINNKKTETEMDR